MRLVICGTDLCLGFTSCFCFCVGISHLQYIVGYGSSFFFFFLCYFPIPSSLFNLPFFLAEIFLMYRRRLRESNFPTWGWYRKFQRGICCPKLEQSVAYLLPRLCGLGSWNKVPRGFRWFQYIRLARNWRIVSELCTSKRGRQVLFWRRPMDCVCLLSFGVGQACLSIGIQLSYLQSLYARLLKQNSRGSWELQVGLVYMPMGRPEAQFPRGYKWVSSKENFHSAIPMKVFIIINLSFKTANCFKHFQLKLILRERERNTEKKREPMKFANIFERQLCSPSHHQSPIHLYKEYAN